MDVRIKKELTDFVLKKRLYTLIIKINFASKSNFPFL